MNDDETDTVAVIFDDQAFSAFTVKVVDQHTKEDSGCHCSEKSFVGDKEVQEWKIELDESLPEVDESVSSDTTDGRLFASPDSMTDQQAIFLSEHVPPSDSVTQYSLLSESKNVEVSYTFHLKPNRY